MAVSRLRRSTPPDKPYWDALRLLATAKLVTHADVVRIGQRIQTWKFRQTRTIAVQEKP